VGAHRPEFVLHAGPDAAQVDRVHAVEGLGRLVGGVGRWGLDAGVVERDVEPAEGVDRALDQGGDLVLVGDIAADTERSIAGGGQLVGGGTKRLVVDVGEHNGSTRFGEGLGGGQPHPGAGPGDQGDLAGEVVGRVHGIASVSARPGQTRGVVVKPASSSSSWSWNRRSPTAGCGSVRRW
jgi:hypothetical protein